MSEPSLELTPSQRAAIAQLLTTRDGPGAYPYPWEHLERDLAGSGRPSLPMVGYGSLVNLQSAARTLREEALTASFPVVVFGARRVFDYEIGPHVKRYRPGMGTARAGLNAYVTREPCDVLNGLLYPIFPADVAQLRRREVDYDLVPAPYLAWEHRTESEPRVAYILHRPRRPGQGSRDMTPHLDYYRICRDGARQVGAEFLALWLRSTYLADGVTPVGEWESTVFPDLPAG